VARRHGDADACAVIDRAGAQVPRIQVTADHHHFLGQAAAGDLADHVLRGVAAIPAAIQRDADAGGAARDQPVELVCIRAGQRGRRYRRQAFIEAGDTGMRHAVRIGAGRTHDVADRALADGLGRATAAHGAADAVVLATAAAVHGEVDVGDLARQRTFWCGLQGIQALEAHHFGFDRSGRAAAQGGDGQRLRMRAEYRGVFTATLPLREGDRLGPDLVETQCLELGLGPFHGTGIGFAAGHARPDFGGQRLHHLPAGGVGQRLFAQLRGGADRRIGDAGRGGCVRRAGRGAQQQGGKGEGSATHGFRSEVKNH
jgi:hypothetical protein